MARPRKPTQLKILNGSASHDPQRINKKEPKIALSHLKPPSGLSKEARAEWKRITQILFDAQLTTEADLATVLAYCTAFGNIVWAERTIASEGRLIPEYIINKETGTPYLDDRGKPIIAGYVTHPAIRIHKDNVTALKSYAASLGLSPADRSRVSKIADDEEPSTLLKLVGGQ